MERLTYERCNGIKSGYWSPAKKEEIVQALGKYEDTGLTPEEITAVVSNQNVDALTITLFEDKMEGREKGCEYCLDDCCSQLDWKYGLDHILPDYKFCPMCGRQLNCEKGKTMTDRDKLAVLLDELFEEGLTMTLGYMADHLIENGVTVQKRGQWLPVDENEESFAAVVPRPVFEQVRWERDTAIAQLWEDYGVGLGERKGNTNNWISVKDRLPEPFVSVLVYMPMDAPCPLAYIPVPKQTAGAVCFGTGIYANGRTMSNGTRGIYYTR